MSFTLNRDINNKAVKKNVTITNTIKPISLKASIGTTGSSEFATLNTLTLNNTQVTTSATELNYLQAIPGIAEASKAIILDNSRNIGVINNLTCTSNIIVNGNLITSNNDISGGSSNDINNIYLTSITPGIGKESKALITDSNSNIKNINTLGTNNLKIMDQSLTFDTIKTYHLDNIKNITTSNISTIETFISRVSSLTSVTDSNITNGEWNSICWSDELEIFVAVNKINNTTSNKVMVSNNAFDWTSYPTPDSNPYNGICWSPKLQIFIAVGNTIARSSNGTIWTLCNIPYYISLQSVCWSEELSLFVAVGNGGGNNNRVLISNDGISWNVADAGFNHNWVNVCWAKRLNLFVAVASSGENIYRVMVSNNGVNWNLITHTNFTNIDWYSIIWSEELGMFIASVNSSNRLIRSYDGINWIHSYPSDTTDNRWASYNIIALTWIQELKIFVGLMSNSIALYYSYDGIKWEYVNTGESINYTSVAWSSILGRLVFVSTNSNRITLSNHFITPRSTYKNKNNIIYVDQNTNYVGFNTKNPQKPLEINHNTGNCLKLTKQISTNSTNHNYLSFDITNDGILNLTCANNTTLESRSINILTDYLNYGLKLNNTLITTRISEFNYLKNITSGIASSNKVLVADNNRNISNINILSCNALSVNGVNIDDSTNNEYLTNIESGIASASKGLITDISNNIRNINQLDTKEYNIPYNNLYGGNINETIYINNLNNKTNLYKKITPLNQITSSSWITLTDNQTWVDIVWSPELNLFILVGNNILKRSNDGINWTTVNTSLVSTVTFKSIAWSSELGMFVLTLSNVSSRGIMISYDGINWTLTEASMNNINSKVIWVSKLKSFIVLTLDTNDGGYNGYISHNGISWARILMGYTYNGITTKWSDITWSENLSLLILSSSNNKIIATSPDAFNWSYYPINDNNNNYYNSITWSPELNMGVAVNGLNMTYSYDSINWYRNSLPNSTSQIIWSSELNLFIAVGFSTSFSYSSNGINWTSFASPSSANWIKVLWIPDLSMLMIVKNDQISYIVVSGITDNASNLFAHKSQLTINKLNGRLGLGTELPNYQLELSTDSAGKPSSTTWVVSSDSRLKENIENANLDLCYNIIKNLNLKKYTWKDNIFDKFQIYDRSKLGWIADEVEEIFPKAVEIKKAYELDDCKVLNVDQILTSIYGFSQKIINEYEELENEITTVNDQLNQIESFISKLDIN
jgi:hypothetical protein